MRFAVFYRRTLRAGPEMFKTSIPSVKWFLEDWSFMGVMEADDIDGLFHNLNEPSGRKNILCHPEHPDGAVLQRTAVRMAGHTSMSVGDIAIEMDSGKAFICASNGWDLLEEISLMCRGGVPI